MGGKEALSLPWRLEPLHDPLSSSGRLMRVFGPVIEALVLPMLDPGHDLPLGSGVALQLVRDEHTRGSTLLLEKLAEQALGGLLVAPALDENIENEAVLVDGTPEPMLFPGEADDDLIEVPFVATARRAPADPVGEFPAEFEAPLPDRLVRHRDAAGGQHLLDHAQAQREPKIQPYRVADNLSGVSMAGVNRVSRRPHPTRLPRQTRLLPSLLSANLAVPLKLFLGHLDLGGCFADRSRKGGDRDFSFAELIERLLIQLIQRCIASDRRESIELG